MNKLQQSFIYTFWILSLYHSLNIINFIYIEKNNSFQLSYDMIPWAYYLINNLVFMIVAIIIILPILNLKQYILYSKNKDKNLLYSEDNPTIIKTLIAFIIAEVTAFLYMINFKLLVTIDQVLNLYWLKKGLFGLKTDTTEIQSQLLITDYIFLLIPFLIFLFIKLKIFRRMYSFLKYSFVITFVIFAIMTFTYEKGTERNILSMAPNALNPFIAFFLDIDYYFKEPSVPDINFEESQLKSIKLISNDIIKENNEFIETIDNNNSMNVMVLLTESMGMEFVKNTRENPSSPNNPMPFLNKISKSGVWFENMYSNAGSTGEAVLAITTGLNVYMGSDTVYSKSLRFPTINKYTQDHEVFFEHASNMRTWFPKGLLKNNEMELKDMIDMEDQYPKVAKNLAIKEKYALDEFVTDFINKIKSNKKVIGYYLNYNTHFPYFDGGIGEYHPDEEHTELLERQKNKYINKKDYYKALNYWDTLLKGVFEKLKTKGVLDNTIIIILGDHGQSFGQHGIWTHGEVYNNITKIPTLIWQPKLIKPKIFKSYVSQADLFPTILDLINEKYDDSKIQGISLLSKTKRKYLYTKQMSHMLIDTEKKIQMIINSKLNECKIYDLIKDRYEEHPKECTDYQEMKQVMFKYINYQSNILSEYKDKLKNRKNK